MDWFKFLHGYTTNGHFHCEEHNCFLVQRFQWNNNISLKSRRKLVIWISPCKKVVLPCLHKHSALSLGALHIQHNIPLLTQHIINWTWLKSSKVSRCYSVTFLNQTPIFDWCVVGEDQRTNTVEKHAQKRLDYIFQFLLCTPQTQLRGPTYVFS